MKLFIFGFGYTAQAFVKTHKDRFSFIRTVARSGTTMRQAASFGVKAYRIGPDGNVSSKTIEAVYDCDCLLICAPPAESGDPALALFHDTIAVSQNLKWVGYLSTLGVYGDAKGAWVDETMPCAPTNVRSRQRVYAEQQWLQLASNHALPVHIFRLAGIYGPFRSALDTVSNGRAKRIVKPGQFFNRIHVDDIVQILHASIVAPRPHAIYNVCDDEPCAPELVLDYACHLLNKPPLPSIPFAEADLSLMAASFYVESKRARNNLIKEELGIRLAYPSYREGLNNIFSKRAWNN